MDHDKIDEIKKSKRRNISYNILKFIKKFIPKKWIGYYYNLLHSAIIFFGSIVILFNNNLCHLMICLLIVSLDGIANVVCHDCPLTTLEKKYLKTSLCHYRKEVLKSLNISYKCNHIYESQLEIIVNIWSLIVLKILILILIRTFSNQLIINL